MSERMRIRARFTDMLWRGNFAENIVRLNKTDGEAEQLLATLVPAGEGMRAWADIDYAQQTRSTWPAQKHYGRLQKLLQECGKERLDGDAAYRTALLEALNYWIAKDYTNPNWWHNEIGVPRSLADIALLMYEYLSEAQLAGVCRIVSRGSMSHHEAIEGSWTGANLIWGAANTIKYALLTEDEPLLRRAVDRAARELQPAAEGIQSDGSFFQHGPRLYSGGYGRSFAYDMAQLAYALQGTSYQFAQERLDCLMTHILDGLRHMTQKDALDWACLGREITRPDAVNVGLVRDAAGLLAETAETPRKDKLNAYIAEMDGENTFTATKYFPDAALLCHHFDGLYVGAKFLGGKLWCAEICNGEGELCRNMGYGTHTTVMRTGEEYINTAPVWDYARIPGTTARVETDEQLLARRDWWSVPLQNDCFGGWQREQCACIWEKAEHDGIAAMVTDFAFPEGFVSLGCGITGEEEPLVTTVEQCKKLGDVVVEENAVIHNGIKYVGLNGAKLCAEVKTVTGAWNRNNFAESAAPVTEEMLHITIAHEAGKTGSYAYLICAADKSPAVEVLRNDEEAQSIRLAGGAILQRG